MAPINNGVNNPNITGGNTVFKRLTTLAMSCSFAAAVLAGCGGGNGGGTTPAVPSVPQSNKTANVSMTFHLSNAHGTASRGRKYTSRNTAGLGISYRVNGSSTVFPASVSALRSPMFASAIGSGVSTNNVTCATASSSGAYSCTVLVAVPVGYDDLQITTWDQAPQASSSPYGATFASTANDLSTNTISDQLIVQNTTNTINYTLSGVVASVALSVSPNSLVSGGSTAQTTTLNVLAVDADGNIIIGNDQYVDNAGNPVKIVIKKTEDDPAAPAGGTPPADGNVQFASSPYCASATQCSVSDPTVQSFTVNYNNFQTNSATFTATATSSAMTIPSIPVNAVLKITNTTVTGGIGAAGSPTMNVTQLVTGSGTSITSGIFGNQNVYALGTDSQGNNSIFQITTGSSPSVSGAWSLPNNTINRIAMGPDGEVYVTMNGGIAWLDLPTGTVQSQFVPANLTGIVTAGQNLYAAVPNSIGSSGIVKFALPTAQNTTPIPNGNFYNSGLSPNSGLGDLAYDGANIWAVETALGQVAKFDLSTNTFTETAISGLKGSLNGIAYGGDGYLYVSDSGGQVVKFQPSSPSTQTAYATSGSPQGITAATGAVYFTETAASGNLIGRLATNAAPTLAVGEYGNGVPSGVLAPAGIVQGADGQIYFSEVGGSNVGYFQP